MKVKNEAVAIYKNDQHLFTVRNRIVNNGLDWFMFHVLPESFAASIYPRFVMAFPDSPDYDTTRYAKSWGFGRAYAKLDTAAVLDDTSMDMDYDFQMDKIGNLSDVSGLASVEREYTHTILASEAGRTLQTIGFGLNYSMTDIYAFDQFLMAYVQVGFLGITFAEGDIFRIVRQDTAETDFEVDKYGANDNDYGITHILQWSAEISSITIYSEYQNLSKTYDIQDLTLTKTGAGTLEITGFDNFYFADGTLYPYGVLYPSNTLYPVRGGKQTKLIVTYENIYWSGDDYFNAAIDLNKATISNDNGVLKLTYSYERG